MIRPSLLVRPWNVIGVDEEEAGERSVRETGTEAAGVPVNVSRMWQVIGGRGVDIVGGDVGLLVGTRWDEMLERRDSGDE